MKLADVISLARAGYKMKDIQALEEKEKESEDLPVENEDSIPEKTESKEEESDSSEEKKDDVDSSPEENNEEDDLLNTISLLQKDNEDLKKQIKDLQLKSKSKDHSTGDSDDNIDDIIKDFCND